MEQKQLEIGFEDSIIAAQGKSIKTKLANSTKTSKEVVLEPIKLPDTKLDLVEQFAFALQNRDAIGLRQLIDENDTNSSCGSREAFISKFVGYCEKMNKKHKGIYVHTVPGKCGRVNCGKGEGLGVTVSTISDNKLLWRFNLVLNETAIGTIRLYLCREFKVLSEDIPF